MEAVVVEVHGLQVMVTGPRNRRPGVRILHKIGSRYPCRRRPMPMERADAIRAARASLAMPRTDRPIRFQPSPNDCPHCGYPDPCRADVCPGCGRARSSNC